MQFFNVNKGKNCNRSSNFDIYLELVPVGDCHGGGVVWKVLDPTVFSIVDMDRVTIPPIENTIGCVGRRLKALREGYTVLVAKYHQHTPDHSAHTLEARVTIAGFPPLEVSALQLFSLASRFAQFYVLFFPLFFAGLDVLIHACPPLHTRIQTSLFGAATPL